MKLITVLACGLFAFSCVVAPKAEACSRVVYHGPGNTILTGRTMDWKDLDMKTKLWIFPKGMERDGRFSSAPFKWKSKYGSVIVSVYDAAASEGMNEKGLVANILWLAESEYPDPSSGKPLMSLAAWAQYVLDSFATVDEAVRVLAREEFSVITGEMPGVGGLAACHLAISDPTGDSAIFEYVGGKLLIHHGREYTVMTNSPIYDQQLALNSYWKEIGGLSMLPGTNRSADRFVRASFYLNAIPKTANIQMAVAGTFSVIRNVSVPLGIATPDHPNISSTLWRTVSDQKNRVLYFESALEPSLFWVDMRNADFSKGAPVKVLVIQNGRFFAGDASSYFEPAKPFEFLGEDQL